MQRSKPCCKNLDIVTQEDERGGDRDAPRGGDLDSPRGGDARGHELDGGSDELGARAAERRRRGSALRRRKGSADVFYYPVSFYLLSN
jgi:hypothetical protein